MSFTDRLLLWLHVGFAIFTLGPVAAAMMATPRYIRTRDLAVLRYLTRTTGIFGLLSVGVFLFGLLLGRNDFNQAWLAAAMTLFVVSAALLVLVFRDQRRAINAIAKTIAGGEAARAATPGSASRAEIPDRPEAQPAGGPGGTDAEAAERDRPYATDSARSAAAAAGRDDVSASAARPGGKGDEAGASAEPAEHTATAARHAGQGASDARVPSQVATVEKGRIAMMAGVISAIWLVILVLMVWHG